jgi:hypothetical protein
MDCDPWGSRMSVGWGEGDTDVVFSLFLFLSAGAPPIAKPDCVPIMPPLKRVPSGREYGPV